MYISFIISLLLLRILEVLCKNLRLEDGFDHVTLAHATPGFVGGDLTLLVKEAAMIAIRRILNQQQQQQQPDDDGASTCTYVRCTLKLYVCTHTHTHTHTHRY